MTNQTVTRVAAPIAALSALLLVLSVVAAWYVWDMQERASGPIASSVASVTAAQELEISIREVSHQFNRYLIMLDRKHLEPVPRLKARTAAALANAEASSTSPAEEALMRRTRQGYERFFAEYERLLAHPPREGMYSEIIKLTDTVLTPEIVEPAHEYLRLNEGSLTQASDTNQQLARRLVFGMVAVGLFGSAGGLLGGWVIAATVRRNIARTEARLLMTAEELDRAARRQGLLGGGDPADPLDRVSVSVSAVIERLRETERAALRAEQLAWVGQMAAGIAHEIRNPLMAIKLLVQAGAERPGGPALRPRDFGVLDEEICRLEQIVSGFLDFARPPRPNPRQFDALESVAQALDGVQPRAELQGVSLELDRTGGPVVVSADPNQLRQVFLNLLINALDAQPRGGSIRLAVRADRSAVVLTVADAGPGIAPGVADRIFEPFVSTKESGLGLGLSICRRIAEAHGGTLSAGDRPGGGAVFTLRIPTGGAALSA
ncbi:sensor histidine kinase [Gemmata sp.]|uniref:sensor histidine kinase n=1 Tax=Gemmata sp. TaxID=1914242 RepID=UPI003F6FB3A6